MSMMLVFKWLTPAFALAVVATVWIVGGPMAAGLCMIAFLLGVASCELHHMRWTAVEEAAPAAESDSAFLALMAANRVAPAAEAIDPETPPAVPEPPKRNFRVTARGMATGSGEIRLELRERRQLHARAAAEGVQRRAVGAPAWPTAPSPAPAGPVESPPVEPLVLELAPDMITPNHETEAGDLEASPPPEVAEAQISRPVAPPAPPRTQPGVPPPSVLVKAAVPPGRKRETTEAFRSSYVQTRR
jgi:hypothetical protein